MPCGTLTDIKPAASADDLALGLDNNELGLIVQSVKVTNKTDKKEALGTCGEVIAVNYYNKSSEIEVQGLGSPGNNLVASVASLANLADLGIAPVSTSAIIIDEVSTEYNNEDYKKTTFKLISFEGMSSAA